MKYLVLIIFILSTKFIFAATSCSSKGTHLVYLNGVLNSEEDPVIAENKIAGRFSYLLNGSGSQDVDEFRKRFDTNGNVKVSSFYQRSNFKMAYKGAIDIETIEGTIVDIHEVASQYLKNNLLGKVSAPKVEELSALNFWDGLTLTNAKAINITSNELEEYRKAAQSYLIRSSVEYSIIPEDLTALENYLKPILKSGEKVILISHSQGNWYANDVYDLLFEDPLQDTEVLNKKQFFGNLQVASPASLVKAPLNEAIKGYQDQVVSGLFSLNIDVDLLDTSFGVGFGGVLFGYEPNIHFSPNFSSYDKRGHNFVGVYLENEIKASFPNLGGSKDGPFTIGLEDLFYLRLEGLANKLAPNCCIDSQGNLFEDEFDRHTYNKYEIDSATNERVLTTVVENEGGWVSRNASVSENSEVHRDAVICADVTLNGYNMIGKSTLITGKVEMENVFTRNSEPSLVGDRIFIHGLGTNGINITGDSFDFMGGEDFPLILGATGELGDNNTTVENALLEIVGLVDISGEGRLHAFNGSALRVEGVDNRTNIVLRRSDINPISKSAISTYSKKDNIVSDSTILSEAIAPSNSLLNNYDFTLISGNIDIKNSVIKNSVIANENPDGIMLRVANVPSIDQSFIQRVNISGGGIANSQIRGKEVSVPALGYQEIVDGTISGASLENSDYGIGVNLSDAHVFRQSTLGDFVTVSSSSVEKSVVEKDAQILSGSTVRESTIKERAIVQTSSSVTGESTIASDSIITDSVILNEASVNGVITSQICNMDGCFPR